MSSTKVPNAARRTVTFGSRSRYTAWLPSVTCQTCPLASRMSSFGPQPSNSPGMWLAMAWTGSSGRGRPKAAGAARSAGLAPGADAGTAGAGVAAETAGGGAGQGSWS